MADLSNSDAVSRSSLSSHTKNPTLTCHENVGQYLQHTSETSSSNGIEDEFQDSEKMAPFLQPTETCPSHPLLKSDPRSNQNIVIGYFGGYNIGKKKDQSDPAELSS
eukprot:CAMPEP_0170482298 /NCGR_PEP_ID=MMETSP0208-20121228/2380_1 /TAXON_ID=197538 /ORGANISM="Strombidium inclinatum, Strain S3" /LENGTH=106 /DNA_ID=CAMNT_0010755125 /DNA_START=1646 /DNA_END=1969 /DNA_ORIENTATION=+